MAEARAPAPRWFFTREQLENSPSRRCGMEADKELSNRQQAANLIQDMGQRLNVTQLTINTAIVYMHRFYMLHSFTKYHRNIISPTALFLAAKVEEQPRKLEHVIKVSHACLNPPDTQLDTKSDVSASFAKPQPAMVYLQQTQELVVLETILLQTLGFEITIEHPHTDVVKCTQLVRASKDLAQTSYFMATNSLHLTTFCLQYKPTVIACVCIHLACKWSNWEIPVSTDGKHWWEYVDQSVTLELLDELTHEFLQILEKTPSRLKRIRNWRAHQALKKPKSDGQLDNSLINSSMVPNSSILVDPVGSLTTNTSFSKASTSAFPAPVALNSGSMAMQTAHNTEDLAILTSAIPSTSYNMASHHEWPQPQEQTRTEQIYSQKQDPAPVVQYNLNFQQGTTGQMHPGLHQRPDKASDHSLLKSDPIQKVSGKHQGQIYAPAMAVSHKMSLDKYREKRKLETVELDVKEQYIPVHLDPQQHKKRTQSTSSSSRTSPIKMKLPNASGEKIEKHSSEKSVSLKLRIPIPPNERISSKEDLKMKIKVASADRHSSSDEGNGKSKHTSPHVSKEPKEKHKEHSSNRHHSSSHKHSHAHSFGSGSSNNSNKSTTDGMPTTVLRSPMGLPNDNACNSSSSRKRPHAIDASYNHHSKMSKTSKSSGSSSSSSVKQYISSQNTILNYPLPPPPPVTYQVGYGHLSTLVKLDKKPVETNGPDASHEYGANSKHLNYKDTFDMLDSLLSAQGMNM